MAYDTDKFDNVETSVALMFRGEEHLTMAFPPMTIPAKSYEAGIDSPPLHAAIKQAIYDSIRIGMSAVCDLSTQDLVILDALVENSYQESRTDHTSFSFSVLQDNVPLLTYVGASKYLHNANGVYNIVACVVPEIIKL